MDDASIAGPNHAADIFLECFSYFWYLLRCTYAAEGPKLGYAGLLLWFNRDLGSLVQARVTGVATLRFATSGDSCRDHNRVNICHLACYGIASAVNVLTRTSEWGLGFRVGLVHLSPEPLCTLRSLKGALINSIFVTKY
jgi:hypothetical protein